MKPSGWFWGQVGNLAFVMSLFALVLYGAYLDSCPIGALRTGTLALMTVTMVVVAFLAGRMLERD